MNYIKGNLLYLTSRSHGLVYNRSVLYDVDLNSGHREQIVRLPTLGFKGLLGRVRILERFFRLEPRSVCQLDSNRYVLCYRHVVWLVDISHKTIDLLQIARKGFSNPLNFCSDGECVYWGDYGNNSGHAPVNIYRLDSTLNLQIIYSFPSNTIRHIHNIVYDTNNKCFFILTGDLEENAGIYVATENWRNVSPLVTGEQNYRAVVGFPLSNGFIYATDAVEEDNHIFLLQDNQVRPLCSFPGSCIYGTETNDYYVFASTVEPPEGRGFFNLFTYRLGKGIKDRYAHLLIVCKSDLRPVELVKVKKDIWPMKLFQYGALLFPGGQRLHDDLWFYSVACAGDGISRRISFQ